MSVNDNLTPKQRRFVLALLQPGATLKGAGAAAGISEATAYRWGHNPAIRAALQAAEAEALAEARRALLGLALPAVKVLGLLLADEGSAAGARLRAADLVLQRLLQLREATEIEARLTELEKQLGVNDGH